MKSLDCRGMACPMPVVTVKKALEEAEGDGILVLVDDGPSRDNVTRFAVNRGFMVEEKREGNGFSLHISPAPEETSKNDTALCEGRILLVSSDRLGEGPEELGKLLMKNFIITLLDVAEMPERIFFLNRGVLITTEGSEVLEALEKLVNRGVEVMSCGVCLDFFNARDRLEVGSITNMFTIAESLLRARLVIRL